VRDKGDAMSIKTILVHADAARSAPSRIRLAVELAAAEHAHVICAAMTGISRFVYAAHEAVPHNVIRPDLAQLANDWARQALENFSTMATRLGIDSCEARLVQDDAYGGLVLQSRYADLIVLSQADRSDPATGALLQDLPEYVVLNSCRPVLIVPYSGPVGPIGHTVLVGWDGSLQASRAITHAIPILRQADQVIVAMLDPIIGIDEHGEEPGADIGLFLARHGITVNVTRQSAPGDVGEALLALADHVHADLLVMGAYGHTRFREIMLGGVTRTILNTMTVPVLLSH